MPLFDDERIAATVLRFAKRRRRPDRDLIRLAIVSLGRLGATPGSIWHVSRVVLDDDERRVLFDAH